MPTRVLPRLIVVSCIALVFSFGIVRAQGASVWKVTAPNGRVLYLGGSVHMLKSTDYPLPPEYNRAFDASSRLVFEAEPKSLTAAGPTFLKAGKFPKGDTLKNHVDPRTYDYLRRFFGRLNVPEEKFAQYRPWLIAMMLQASGSHGFSVGLGVESFANVYSRGGRK